MNLEGVKQDDPAEGAVDNVNVPSKPSGTGVSVAQPIPQRWASPLLSVLRIVAAFLFMVHGTQKLFGFPLAEPRPPVELASLMGAAGLLEFAGGLLLLVGLFSRPVAFILSGEMAVAYFNAHAPQGFWPALNGGELAVLFCFLFLFIAAAGPGAWSLDAVLPSARMRRRHTGSGHHRRWAATH